MSTKRVLIATLLALIGLAKARTMLKQHPVREEIVQKIKEKATRWTPSEID